MLSLVANRSSAEDLMSQFERFVRRDPGGRGLIGPDADTGLGAGELLPAARELAQNGRCVCLVTGFFIPTLPPAHPTATSVQHVAGHAETDGPLGTALLAAVLKQLGMSVRIITDVNCESVVHRAAIAAGLADHEVVAAPLASAAWRAEFWQSEFGRHLTHLIAIERVGPSYDVAALQASGATPDEITAFQAAVTPAECNHCYNMRGLAIDAFTGDLHALFEEAQQRRQVSVLAVGDGGNEIGMGRFSWSQVSARLGSTVAAKIPCRIAAQHTVISGTSNWGAYALAAAVALLKQRVDVLESHTVASQLAMLTAIVQETGAVDGVTRRSEATVDGLPFLTYIQPWIGIRQLLELSD